MTDNEIIKAFKCLCGEEIFCRECKYSGHIYYPECRQQVAKDTLDLINRQQADNDRLTEENNRLKSLILEFMDCVSKWSAKHDNDLSDEINKIPVMDKCKGKVKEIKSEAVKELRRG